MAIDSSGFENVDGMINQDQNYLKDMNARFRVSDSNVTHFSTKSHNKDAAEVQDFINPKMLSLKSMLEKRSKLIESLDHQVLQHRNGNIPKPLQVANQSKQVSKDSPELKQKIMENNKEYELIRFQAMIEAKKQSLAKLEQELNDFPERTIKSFTESVTASSMMIRSSSISLKLINENLILLFKQTLDEEMMRTFRAHTKLSLLATHNKAAKLAKQDKEKEEKANAPELSIEDRVNALFEERMKKLPQFQSKGTKAASRGIPNPSKASNKQNGKTQAKQDNNQSPTPPGKGKGKTKKAKQLESKNGQSGNTKEVTGTHQSSSNQASGSGNPKASHKKQDNGPNNRSGKQKKK